MTKENSMQFPDSFKMFPSLFSPLSILISTFLIATSWGSAQFADDSPQFLPNALEVDIQVTPFTSKSVYYLAQCNGVWLEIVLTACDYDSSWSANLGFYSTKHDDTPNTQNALVQVYQPQVAVLINEFHRKIIRIAPENSEEGIYKLTLYGFTKATTVRAFTSESEQSNYKDVFYPTSNITSDTWTQFQENNKLKNMWLSWPPVSEPYKALGDHVTCLTVVSQMALDKCPLCIYSAMKDNILYDECEQPLFRRCDVAYDYEPYLPASLRYVEDRMIGLVSKLHPVTNFITPYIKLQIPDAEYREIASPYMVSYVTLNPKEEIRMDLHAIVKMGWRKPMLIIQPCSNPIRVRVNGKVTVVKYNVAVLNTHSEQAIKLRNGHKTKTVMRYYFTDDLALKSPITDTSNVAVRHDWRRLTCSSISLVISYVHRDTEFCAFARSLDEYASLEDHETPQCVNPDQGHFGVPKESIFQNCQLTSNSGYFDIRGTEKLDIQLKGVKPNTRYAIEVFAKPVNGFYSIGIWTKVDTVFEVTTPAECSTAYTMSQQNVDAD